MLMAPLGEAPVEAVVDLLERVRGEEQDVRVALEVVDCASRPELRRPRGA